MYTYACKLCLYACMHSYLCACEHYVGMNTYMHAYMSACMNVSLYPLVYLCMH